MNKKHVGFRKEKEFGVGGIICLVFAVLAVLSLFLVFPSTAGAFFWQNPVERYLETADDYSQWEAQRAKKERALFYDHCSAIEWKMERGETVSDARFIKPCEDNNIGLYFDIRKDDFSTVR